MNQIYQESEEVALSKLGSEMLSDKTLPIFKDVPKHIVDSLNDSRTKFYVLECDNEDKVATVLSLSLKSQAPNLGVLQIPTTFITKKFTGTVADFELLTNEFWEKKKSRFIEIEDYKRANVCKKIQELIKENM